MFRCLQIAAIIILGCNTLTGWANSPWGADYFPNVPLITEAGNKVYFYDDLIKDKIVVINFIYTSCPDSCPLETAQLVKVQNILGDRLGRDVFFYSISIDPQTDTPAVMLEYKKRFAAHWTFLTGNSTDITQLRRKLGLYIEEIQDGSNNHNVSMIIGNQRTGRWMKRSPFENPYVLADQIGNWLTGWTRPQSDKDYAKAPQLRSISRGEQLFRTRCATCHTITGDEPKGALGPDLLGVTRQRDMSWLLNWLRKPDQMLAQQDSIAMELYKKYNNLAMPNMRLNNNEALALINYIDEETQRLLAQAGLQKTVVPVASEPGDSYEKSTGEVLIVVNAWIREAYNKATVCAGYMTLVNPGSEMLTLVGMESDLFQNIEIHAMTTVDGLLKMRKMAELEIPAAGQVHLEPGGKHLMLMGPRQPITTGQTVDITLIFRTSRKQTVSVRVGAS